MNPNKSWTLYPASNFKEYASQWDSLNSERSNSLLLSSDFIQPLLNHFAEGNELLAILGDSLSPDAMTIVSKTGFGRWMTFQPSQAPIGCWVQRNDTGIEEACRTLSKTLPGINLAFSITQQDPDVLPRPRDNTHLTTLDYIETARITIDSNFDDYWAKRGKNLRQGLKRQRNRLQRENIQSQLIEITNPEHVYGAILEYGTLESAGWKSETGTAINIENAQGQFYVELMQAFCKKKQGSIYQYSYNDNLVATDLCIHDGESIIILKTTYDQSINTSSPAMLMRQDAFKTLFDEKGIHRIEFYGKVMDWHKKWSNEIRRMYHINYKSRIATAIKSLIPTKN